MTIKVLVPSDCLPKYFQNSVIFVFKSELSDFSSIHLTGSSEELKMTVLWNGNVDLINPKMV